jgi:hypothetical protein
VKVRIVQTEPITVEQPTDFDSWAALGENDEPIASGGFYSYRGRRWVYLNIDAENLPPKVGARIVLALRKRLREVDVPVYSALESRKHETAERLDALLGFRPTDEWFGGMRLWVYGADE